MKTLSFGDFCCQGDEIKKLRLQIEQNRLVHALLITGDPGTGKRSLASLIAQSLMCGAETGIPCGICSGCTLALSGEHPDITIIEKGVPLSAETARGKSSIPVDDIREMIRIVSRYSFEGGNRAVIIRDAENMTVQAQNCLLKILEEPPAKTFFLLTSSHPDQLLDTVRSRCRPLKLIPMEVNRIVRILTDSGVDPDTAKRAAAASSGSIGYALRLAGDSSYWKLSEDVMNAFFRNTRRSEILALSTAWKDRKSEADILFSILENHVRELLSYRLGFRNGIPSDYPERWQKFAANALPGRFSFLLDRISDARKQNSSNVNFQAVIEQLLLVFIGESDLWGK